MKHIIFDDPYNKKKIFDCDSINTKTYIEKMYNNVKDDDIIKQFEIEIKKKINSYKNQDKQKNKFDPDQFITYTQIIKKLYECELKCYYCQCNVVILFNKKRESIQWTLERLDNNIGHYDTNTCISCLKCNLQRRTDNHEYFKNGKQLKINIIK
jgi:hypothetical protein